MLCSVHANFSLLIKALNSVTLDKPSFSLFPDHFSQVMTENCLDALVQSINAEEVTKLKERTGPFYTYKEKNANCSVTEREGRLKKSLHLQLCAHMKRIKAQFSELCLIKLNLLYSWIMIQHDFAENYTCQESACNTECPLAEEHGHYTPYRLHDSRQARYLP